MAPILGVKAGSSAAHLAWSPPSVVPSTTQLPRSTRLGGSTGVLLPTRRAVISGLVGLAACGPRRTPDPEHLPSGPIVMGWRWVAGTQHTYRTTLRRTASGVETLRTEEWSYKVVSVDPSGLATLEGRLTALGAGIVEQNQEIPEAWVSEARRSEAESTAPVRLRLSTDGVLRECSDNRIGASLPHRLLDLRLPQHGVDTGASWDDVGLAHHLTGLVPPEVAVSAQGQTHFHDVMLGDEPEAVLWSQASLRIGDGSAGVALQSTARFALTRGVLRSREVSLDGRGLSGSTPNAPGLLVAELREV